MPLIALEGVRYRYPEADRQALDGITAAVEPGQVILLRGPSGSGKSTLLRCLNGLVPHSTGGDFAGRVTVCGLDRAVMRKRIEETIDQVGINALRHRRITTLSGGERQR